MRPRVAPRFDVGDTNQPITEWSITLGKRQSDVPRGWLNRMETYSRLFGIASLFALEVGGRVRRMHVQGILRCRCMANDEGKKILNDHIKAFMPVPRGSGGYVRRMQAA